MYGTRWPVDYVIAKNLKRLREKNRLTQENISKFAGLTVRAYRDIEEDRYIPTINVLVRLAKALRCRLDELVPLDEVE